MRVLEAGKFHVFSECWQEPRRCPFGHRFCSVLVCEDAYAYRCAVFWVGVVVQGMVD